MDQLVPEHPVGHGLPAQEERRVHKARHQGRSHGGTDQQGQVLHPQLRLWWPQTEPAGRRLRRSPQRRTRRRKRTYFCPHPGQPQGGYGPLQGEERGIDILNGAAIHRPVFCRYLFRCRLFFCQGRIVMVSGIAVNRVHPVDGPGNRLHRYRSLGQAQVEGDAQAEGGQQPHPVKGPSSQPLLQKGPQGQQYGQHHGHGQGDLQHVGNYALQARVTTEDPANHFLPDTGKIDLYRSGKISSTSAKRAVIRLPPSPWPRPGRPAARPAPPG